ncbi:MAG: PQQ-like beta-propeller repeat protein, partial [Planctomycetes bacterium]|nr:PQQ-like beta-propeller repeat protein [Planctomycetota bacterium]
PRPASAPEGTRGEMIYCADRCALYALELPTSRSGAAHCVWRAGDWPARPEDYQGDPEFLARIIAAGLVPAGAVVLADDGRVGLLDRLDGHLTWELRLPPAVNAQIHVHGSLAAVVQKSGGDVNAVLVETGPTPPRVLRRRVGDTWPIWSGLAREGLVLVWPQRVVICAADGPLREVSIAADSPLLASVIAFGAASPAESAEGRASGRRGGTTLVLGDLGGRLYAYDVASGAALWKNEPPADAGAVWVALRVHVDLVLAATRRVWLVLRLDTGQRLASGAAAPANRLLDVAVRGRRVHWLAANDTAEAHGVSGTHVKLECAELESDGVQTTIGSSGSTPLADVADLRGVMWLREHLVTFEPRRLRAYTLR